MKKEVLNDKMKKENPFRIPDNYFESFSTRIMQQLPPNETNTESTSRKKVILRKNKISAFERIKPYLYLAAMFAGLYFGIYVFNYQRTRLQQSSAKQETTEESSFIFTDDETLDEMFNFAAADKDMLYDYLAEDY